MVTDYSKGTWSEGTVRNVNGVPTNVGGGVFTPAPTSTPAPTPTPAPTYSRLPSTLPTITPTADVPATPVSTFNESTARSNEIARRSGYISAIENDYKQKVADVAAAETKLGEKDLARANTVSAMTGMAGSPEATSRAGGVDRATKDIIAQKTATLEAQKMREIAGIYDSIDQNVQREKELNAITDANTRTKAVDDMTKSANSSIMSFASQGIDWDTAWNGAGDAAHAKLFQDEVKRTGKSAFEIETLYNASLPPDKKPKEIYSGWKDNDYVTINQKPDGTIATKTIKASVLGISPGTDIGTVTANNTVYWYDKKNPTNSDGTLKLSPIGSATKTGTTPAAVTKEVTDAKNWLLRTYGNNPDDMKKFEEDPAFKAWAIQKAKDATKKPTTREP